MPDLVDQLSFIVPTISIGFVFVLTSINLFFKIRRKFPIKVNCWFCNQNSRVPYDSYNSWTCPHCVQYNGFGKDGDYNCDIPAQRCAKLNGQQKSGAAAAAAATDWNNSTLRNFTSNKSQVSGFNASQRSNRLTRNNGLCTVCNRNQEIKVQHLASFEPENEDNFDEEIVAFRKKLEKTYQLCYRCERTLKRTLNNVKKNVLGSKMAQMGAKGLKLFDLHVSKHNRLVTHKKKQTFTTICLIALSILSLLNLYNCFGSIRISKSKLDETFHPNISHGILVIVSYVSAIKVLILNYFNSIDLFEYFNKFVEMLYNSMTWLLPNFTLKHYYQDGKYLYDETISFINSEITTFDLNVFIDFAAILLSICCLVVNRFKRVGFILSLLLWSLKMILPTMAVWKDNNGTKDLFIILTELLCFTTTLINQKINIQQKYSKEINDNSFHKIHAEHSADEASEVDSEDDESDLTTSSYKSKCSPSDFFSASLHNTSFHSTLPFSSSFSQNKTSSVKNLTTMPANSRANLFNCDPHNSSFPPLDQICNNSFYRYERATVNPLSAVAPKKAQSNVSLNRSNAPFSMPEDFPSNLTTLNLNDSAAQFKNPKLSTSFSVRQRTNVLSPSRLGFSHDNLNSSTQGPLTQTSWVAGGYWNTPISPHKKSTKTIDDYFLPLPPPMMSRTSSQSSGFESHTSSVHNAPNRVDFSRESSVCGDLDHTSVFSEPINFTDSISQVAPNVVNATFRSAVQRPVSHQQNNLVNTPSDGNYFAFNQPQQLYHQFGTQRLMNNTSRAIKRGSLLKQWQENNTLGS